MSHISKKFKLTETEGMEFAQSECFKQGAEGRIFITDYLGKRVLVKERFSKKYRHPTLDAVLTKERITSEIRGLMKCRLVGIRTPAAYAVNSSKNQIIMELIIGKTVKDILLFLEQNIKDGDKFEDKENEMSVDEDISDDEESVENNLSNAGSIKVNPSSTKPKAAPPPIATNLADVYLDQNDKNKAHLFLTHHMNLETQNSNANNETKVVPSNGEINSALNNLSPCDITNIIKFLSIEIGSTLSLMHASNIIHGDLTTSNIIVDKDCKIVMIDFGLSQIKVSNEDKAVDLYVLKRAILSLHSIFSRDMFDWILASYRKANRKQFDTVIKTFAEVELRGRKRCMVG